MTSSFARILISLLSLIHTAIIRELFDTSQSELGNHSLIVARLNLWFNLLRSRLLSSGLLRVIQILVTGRVRALISGVGLRHSVLMTVHVFIRTMARRNFARFFYSTNLFENFLQIFIILEMYREFNGFATECNIDLRFTNPMRHGIHSVENFDFEFVDCQIWHSHHSATLEILLRNILQLFILEEETYWHAIGVAGLVNRVVWGHKWANPANSLLLGGEISWCWSLCSGRHFRHSVVHLGVLLSRFDRRRLCRQLSDLGLTADTGF